MCPIFRFAPAEEASPRAKANLIRGILTGSVDLSRLDQRRVQGGGRLVRALPRLPAGMPGRRGYPAADAREQGGLRGGQRPALRRLADDSARPALVAGQPVEPAGQLGPRQPADALADGEDAGHRPGAEAAAGVVAEFPPPGRPAAADAAGPPQPGQSALLRRHLRQLSRSAVGRGPGRGDEAQRRGGVRSGGPEAVGHGVDRLRGVGPRPQAGPAQCGPAGRGRAAGLPRGGHRACRRAVPGARIPATARRRRRPPGGRQRQRGLHVPLENAPAGGCNSISSRSTPPWATMPPAT